MQVTAQLNYLRIAPRKVRLTAGGLRGLSVAAALAQLQVRVKRGSNPLAKLLHSAIKNAENNFQLPAANLFIKDIIVNEGVKIKRYRPSAMGVAKPIEKKTTHVKLVLGERPSADVEQRVEPRPIRDPSRLAKGKLNFGSGTPSADVATPDIASPSPVAQGATVPTSPEGKSNFGSGKFGIGTPKTKLKGAVASGVKNLSRRFFRRKSI